MNRLFTLILLLVITLGGFAQNQYEVIQEQNDKILKGIISRNEIANDTSFTWFKQNQAGYTPQKDAVSALKSKGSNLQLLAFGGTWCGDTKVIFPKFFSILDASGFPDDRLTIVGVDRNKKTIGHLAEALGVLNVPTIIVLRDGKELGRVVEYGKTGVWDKELADIINSSAQ